MTSIITHLPGVSPASFSLAGQVALVTGATKGIGQGIAIAFAAAGADVVISGRDAAGAQQTLQAVEQYGRRCAFVPCDLGNADDVASLVERAVDQFAMLHVLVNNAGIGPETDFLDIDLEEWRTCQVINLEAPFQLAQAAARHFVAQGAGSIINVSSVNGLRGAAREAHYTAAKHGLIGMTKTMAKELAPQGVRVNAIAPGLVQTAMTQHWFDEEGMTEVMTAHIPARRAGVPTDLGGVAVFLASDAAAYIHGTTIAVDGGLLA